MKTFLCREIILIFCIKVISGAEDTLRLVNLVYRHGDRSPVKTYDNDQIPDTVWKDGLGWLTVEGERMHYSLGRYLRRRYDGFLSKDYKNSEITVTSSSLERCLMSAYSNLAGLYPPSGQQMWNKNITWQPIPVETRPTDEDNMLALHKPCPKIKQLHKKVLQSERVQQILADNKEIMDFLSEKSGISLDLEFNIFRLADTTYCEKQHNFSLPSWMNDTVYQTLLDLESIAFDIMTFSKEETRLKAGPLIKEWLRLTGKKIGDPHYTTKMNMFSAHDTTVVYLLGALGVYNHLTPPYTSTIILELHQATSGDFYIELYFRNVTSQDPDDHTPPHRLTLPGCELKCPYEKFLLLTSQVVPLDWEAECSIAGSGTDVTDQPEHGINYKRAFILTISIGSVVLFLLLVEILVLTLRGRRREGNTTVTSMLKTL